MIRLSDGSTCRVIKLLTSFSLSPIFSLYSCNSENWTEGGFWRHLSDSGASFIMQRTTAGLSSTLRSCVSDDEKILGILLNWAFCGSGLTIACRRETKPTHNGLEAFSETDRVVEGRLGRVTRISRRDGLELVCI